MAARPRSDPPSGRSHWRDRLSPRGSALDRADRLAARGRPAEAVRVLVAENRRRRDPAVEIRLVELRLAAAQAAAPVPGRQAWPPDYRDPFPEAAPGGVPEVDATDLTVDAVGGAVQHHGLLIVRGALDAPGVERIVGAIDRAADRRDADDGTQDEWYRPVPGMTSRYEWLRSLAASRDSTWLADSPASTAIVLDTLERIGMVDLLADHFGERPFISVQKSTLRRVPPKHTLAGWHQDGSFLGPDVRTMNVWIALSACGGDERSPGLEIVPRRVDRLLDCDGEIGSAAISDRSVADVAGEARTVRPHFEPGDAVVFDEHLVHRTHLAAGMTHPRYALECWFFAGSHPAEDYLPLLV